MSAVLFATIFEIEFTSASAQTLASSRNPAPLFHANVDLVTVTVSVLDRDERTVTGLTRNQFAIFEDKAPQTVRYFSHDDAPLAIAIVVDASASMAKRFEDVRYAAQQLIASSNAEDEFHIVVVGGTPRLARDSSGDSSDQLQQTVALLQPDGETALWDSLMAGLNELRSAAYERKAMVVISDGGDNRSRTTEHELKSVLKEVSVQVYAVALYNPFATLREEKLGPLELDELTSVTGGRVISVRDREGTLRAVTQINRELRDEYVLGYYPKHAVHDGKWHKLRVTLDDRDHAGHLSIITKKAYFQPAD
jgi:Ca-activated chloride channel family protein